MTLKEEIKKLENYYKNQTITIKYSDKDKIESLLLDFSSALSIIKKQEETIKELQAENEKLKEEIRVFEVNFL